MYSTTHNDAKTDVRDPFCVTDSDLAHCAAVESCSLGAGLFTHAGHIRLAWTYLRTRPMDRALADCAATIRAFAAHHGAHTKFHATVTEAMMHIIAQEMAGGPPGERFAQFEVRNEVLFQRAETLLAKHFSSERLNDPHAREHVLTPDRAPY